MNTRPIGCCAVLVVLAVPLLSAGCSSGVEDLVARPAGEKPDEAASNQPPPPPPPPPPAKGPIGDQPDPASSKDPTSVGPPAMPPTTTVPQPPPVAPSVPPAAKPQAAPPHVGPSTGQPLIRLSTGVALAQTLPTGTAMSFSVEYEFTEGQPNPSAAYFWVIDAGNGQAVRFRVGLSNRGTLPVVFVRGWRPEHGPFEGHIEDAGGNRLSRSIPLR